MPRVIEFDETFQAEAIETAQPPSGIEAYFSGDEGWTSTCFPEIGYMTAGAALGIGVNKLVLMLADNETIDPAELVGRGNVAMLFSAVMCAGIGLWHSIEQRKRNNPASQNMGTNSERPLDSYANYYAMLAGRMPLPDEK